MNAILNFDKLSLQRIKVNTETHGNSAWEYVMLECSFLNKICIPHHLRLRKHCKIWVGWIQEQETWEKCYQVYLLHVSSWYNQDLTKVVLCNQPSQDYTINNQLGMGIHKYLMHFLLNYCYWWILWKCRHSLYLCTRRSNHQSPIDTFKHTAMYIHAFG